VRFSFRKVNKSDEKLLFRWRNEKKTRLWSFNKKPISFGEHKIFFKDKISDKKNYMWIFLLDKKPCGLVRFNIKGKKIILSYLISKKYRGKKLASIMLIKAKKKICRRFAKATIYAQTLSKNAISIKSLLRAGFILNNSQGKKKIYIHKCI
tara:strand:+ start:182 stop:634 length:453 start_codon:yes stop_codon:yes gene_type:complete